jgi:serine protease Do
LPISSKTTRPRCCNCAGFRLLLVICGLLLTTDSQGRAQETQVRNAVVSKELTQHLRSAISRISPAVVRIRCVGSNSAGAGSTPSSTVTTGLIVSENGEILTSVFGMDGSHTAIFVEDASGNRSAAEIVATDHLRKLVLLKCEPGTLKTSGFTVNNQPQVGAYAVAVGRFYPAAHPSTSLGIISARNRIHGLALQTDAKVSPINYGGPLIDLQGRVTGILVPLSPQDSDTEIKAGVEWYDSGIGFAIPIADALQATDALRAGVDRKRGLLGVNLSTRNPLADKVLITKVQRGSPADQAGLQADDRVIEANGAALERFGQFESIIKSHYAGDSLTVVVKRGEQTLNLSVTLTDELMFPQPGYLGIIPLAASQPDADSQADADSDEEAAAGVAVAVVPGSPAAASGLPDGALITRIGTTDISDAGTLNDAVAAVAVDEQVELWFREAGQQADSGSVDVVCTQRPTQVTVLTDQQTGAVLRGQDTIQAEWSRTACKAEQAENSWYFAPTTPPQDTELGAVILLSPMDKSPELLLREWEADCRLHRQILIVPQNPEQTSLTGEDLRLLATVMAEVAENFSLDSDRVVVVTGEPQVDLAMQAASHPRLPAFHSVAFLESWPRINSSTVEMLRRKSAAFLLLGSADTREQQALRQAAVDSLQQAGLPLSLASGTDQIGPSKLISNWALMLKAH